MKLGICPKCGSRRVRTGKIYILHLARLALGSRRRYCCVCRSRWIGSEQVFLPEARFAAILCLCVCSALWLNYLKAGGWFTPTPDPYQAVGPEDGWFEASESSGMDGEVEALLGEDVTGAYGRAFAAGGAGGRAAFMNRQGGQLRGQYFAGRRGMRGGGSQNKLSPETLELLRRLAATGKTPSEVASEVDNTDKQTLWNKYGSHFASQDEAKAAYDDFQSHRGELPRE